MLTSLYLPVTVMLFGLILRGVSFDFRVKAAGNRRAHGTAHSRAAQLLAACARVDARQLCDRTCTERRERGVRVDRGTMPALYVCSAPAALLLDRGELFDKALASGRRAMPMIGLALARDLDRDAARQRDDQPPHRSVCRTSSACYRFPSPRRRFRRSCTRCCAGATWRFPVMPDGVLAGTVLHVRDGGIGSRTACMPSSSSTD